MKTGPELLAEIAKYPTLDALLDRDLKARPIDYQEFVLEIARQREERALFVMKEQQKRDKKKGQEALPKEETDDE